MSRDWVPSNPQNKLTPNKCHNLFPYDKIKNHFKTNKTQPAYLRICNSFYLILIYSQYRLEKKCYFNEYKPYQITLDEKRSFHFLAVLFMQSLRVWRLASNSAPQRALHKIYSFYSGVSLALQPTNNLVLFLFPEPSVSRSKPLRTWHGEKLPLDKH